MNKYIITDEVNTSQIKPEDILWAGAGAAKAAAGAAGSRRFHRRLPPFAVLLSGQGERSAAMAAALAMRDKSITKITTVKQLERYHNCISDEWKTKVVYVEHPHRKGVLIEATLYKDYILREMVADISNYIMDHLDLSKLVIGLIVSDKGNAKVKVPVEQVNAEATIKCNLNKNYLFSVCDTHAIPSDEEKYVWISQFPDIIAAVKHGSGKMEVRKKVTLDLDVGAGLGKAKLGAGAKKNFEFYITYTKEKSN